MRFSKNKYCFLIIKFRKVVHPTGFEPQAERVEYFIIRVLILKHTLMTVDNRLNY